MSVTTTDKPETIAAPSPAEQIWSWLPDHAHVNREMTGTLVWTWTTPAGVWAVTLRGGMGGGGLELIGPGGQWAFGRPGDEALRQAFGVLVALGAITAVAV